MDGNLAMANSLENNNEHLMPIKETNGWKLYKQSNLHNFEVETPEGLRQIFRHPSFNENELKEKMKPTLIKADEKFEKCKDAFEKLQKEFGVDIDYTMEGDTYGIYEDHLNMTFHIDNVYCYYKLEN